MGAGKTTYGFEIAKLWGWQFIDTDQAIEKQLKISVNSILANYCGSYFRKLETIMLEKISTQKYQVISTGGGIVLSSYNSAIMQSTGVICYLRLGLEQQYQRLKNCQDRPLLAKKNVRLQLQKLAEQRNVLYANIADYTIDSSL